MKKKTSYILIIILTLIFATFYTIKNYFQPDKRDNFPPKLHVNGQFIEDEFGNIVRLRGVNRPHFDDMAGGAFGGWKDSNSGLSIFLTSQAEIVLDILKDEWGVNVLRLITCIDYWKNDWNVYYDGNITRTHREVIKKIIEMAGERNIYVIYCPWNVRDGSIPDPLPFPPHTPHTEVISDEEGFINFWISVIEELGIYPNIIWEIYNEPYGPIEDWYRVWNKIINTIRDTGNDNLIIIQYNTGIHYNNDTNQNIDLSWILDYPFNYSNIIYSTHIYRDYYSFGFDKPYDYETIKKRMEYLKFKDVLNSNKCLFIGEIGANNWLRATNIEEYENEILFFNNTLRILNEWNISYAVWVWFSSFQHSIVDYLSEYISDRYVPKPNEFGLILINTIKKRE